MARENENDGYSRVVGVTSDSSAVQGSQDKDLREQGRAFLPKFDTQGLLSAVVQDAGSHEILMVAFMNQEALDATIASGIAHFYSRSRKRLWKKGESSGNVLHVAEMRVDCDQDALVLVANPAGPTCHTGAHSCFYRRLDGGGLVAVDY